MWSSACSYGIQAVAFLAADPRPGFVPIREISDELGLSYHFMVKVLRTLTEKGVLNSARGPNGGVRLLPPAESISLKDLVLALDGPELFDRCVLHHASCSSEAPCSFHHTWTDVRAHIEAQLTDTTVADLARTP